MAGAGGRHTSKDGRHVLPGATEKRLGGNLSLPVTTCLGTVIWNERSLQFVSQKDNKIWLWTGESWSISWGGDITKGVSFAHTKCTDNVQDEEENGFANTLAVGYHTLWGGAHQSQEGSCPSVQYECRAWGHLSSLNTHLHRKEAILCAQGGNIWLNYIIPKRPMNALKYCSARQGAESLLG